MTVYYFVLVFLPLVLIASAVREKAVSTVVFAGVVISVIFISALRWGADIDHSEYMDMFADNPTLENFSGESIAELYGEPGYLFLSAVFKSLGIHFALLSAACALVSISLKAWIVSRFAKAAGLALCLYLCVHFVTIEFIQIRWAVASAFVALSFYLQFKRKFFAAVVSLALATTFHYFSLIFLLAGFLIEIRSSRFFVATTLVASIAGLLLALGGGVMIGAIDSDLYVVRRAMRYLNESLSDVGFLSYARLAMTPVVFQIMAMRNPLLITDSTTIFLRKVAYACLALTMLVSFVPLMHFRAVVVADLFSMTLLARSLNLEYRRYENIGILSVFSVLYGVWYVIDISNYIEADRVFPYTTWLPLFF